MLKNIKDGFLKNIAKRKLGREIPIELLNDNFEPLSNRKISEIKKIQLAVNYLSDCEKIHNGDFHESLRLILAMSQNFFSTDLINIYIYDETKEGDEKLNCISPPGADCCCSTPPNILEIKSQKINYEKKLSILDTPIKKNKITCGLLRIAHSETAAWTKEQLAFASLLAANIAQAQGAQEKLLLITREKQIALQSSKLATIGQMAGSIAHEINNPLTIIQGKIMQVKKILAADGNKFTDVIESLDKIEKNTQRIVKITRGLKSICRDCANDPVVETRVDAILNECVDISQERLESQGIKIQVKAPQNVFIQCRSIQIEQVILNLLNNAKDAISMLNEKWIKIDTYTKNDTLFITITDSGHGIPRDLSEKIMEPFFTTKAVGKGTGLGLSISKEIIANHNGNMFINHNCENTQFVISLPLLKQLSV